MDFSRPGPPTDNATVESFNGRLRQECLNENVTPVDRSHLTVNTENKKPA
ncbi:hypothetical protein CKQ53_16330 [Lonsdalea britannica]|uniref:Integrase catalytic domain-containing protein n=1 Tax=Lonsdalea britannica TaxID=1082704 RepID=A0AAD0WME6_9GAMM|nr:hypothetical protein CKQ53_16330 [Lonsdalea britannica]